MYFIFFVIIVFQKTMSKIYDSSENQVINFPKITRKAYFDNDKLARILLNICT